jgi:hypothetical protein
VVDRWSETGPGFRPEFGMPVPSHSRTGAFLSSCGRTRMRFCSRRSVPEVQSAEAARHAVSRWPDHDRETAQGSRLVRYAPGERGPGSCYRVELGPRPSTCETNSSPGASAQEGPSESRSLQVRIDPDVTEPTSLAQDHMNQKRINHRETKVVPLIGVSTRTASPSGPRGKTRPFARQFHAGHHGR